MLFPPHIPPFFFLNDTATTEIYTLSLHDALPIYLLGARSPEGCDLLPFWSESYAVLGLRRGLHARSLSWHLGTLGARRSDGVGRLPPGDLTHGDCRRGGAAAVLLPAPARRMASGD